MTASSKGGSPALVRQCLRDAMVDLPSLPAGPCREVDHGQNIPDIRNASDLFSAVVTTTDPTDSRTLLRQRQLGRHDTAGSEHRVSYRCSRRTGCRSEAGT